jgi:hypothetical protein
MKLKMTEKIALGDKMHSLDQGVLYFPNFLRDCSAQKWDLIYCHK